MSQLPFKTRMEWRQQASPLLTSVLLLRENVFPAPFGNGLPPAVGKVLSDFPHTGKHEVQEGRDKNTGFLQDPELGLF